jgi:hypothetical protein
MVVAGIVSKTMIARSRFSAHEKVQVLVLLLL